MINSRDYGILENVIKHCDRTILKLKNLKYTDFIGNEDIKKLLALIYCK